MNPNRCPSRDDLSDFCTGALSVELADEVADHIDGCPECEATLAQLEVGGVTLLAPLRETIPNVDFLAEPELQRARGRVEAMVPYAIGRANLNERRSHGQDESLTQLRDYRLLRILGRGGMGTVYKAVHTRLDKFVAVKLLSERRTRDEQVVARFQREMKAVGKLQHPHIVAAHDAGEVEGRHFLAMEYVEGINLLELVRGYGPLPLADACELVRQAALGLDYAHRHALVHRDVKPSNLMLTAQGQLKILDLGLARLNDDTVADSHQLTEASQIMGTIDYMAPEQADNSHTVDGRADIYSLGCTLYMLLVGETPFGGARYLSFAQKLAAHMHALAPSIADKRPDVPKELADVVRHTMAKSPEARLATAADVATALAKFAVRHDLPALYAAAGHRLDDAPIALGDWPSGATPEETIPHVLTPAPTPPAAANVPQAARAIDRRHRPLVALAALAAGLLGAVVVIKMRDGSRIALDVPGDVESVEVGRTATAAKPGDIDRSAAEWALAMGGRVDVSVNDEWRRVQKPDELPSQPFGVTVVWLRDGRRFADDELVRLEGLTQLRELDLFETSVGDAGLAHLSGLNSLVTLNLRMIRATDAGLKSLSGLTNLEGLDIAYVAFTDTGLGHLTTLKNLRFLQAFTTQRVSDAGLAQLRHLTRLEHLSINPADATDAGLAFVEDLHELQVLDLRDTLVGDEGLTHLASAERLRWLRLGDAKISAEGWRTLSVLPHLTGLFVMRRAPDDRDLSGLAQLDRLEELTITGCDPDDEGMQHLARMTNLKSLSLEPCENITDAGLAHLESLRQLKELKLKGSKVTDAGIARLQAALPACQITR
ncbi:MAG TPA: protein kinase [Pirellulales bacterium]|nr:protein kinase [Pirellulales bacterium]